MLLKAKSAINMLDIDINKEEDLYIYPQLISKLMYLAYGIKLEIAFAVDHLSKHNAGPLQKHYF